MSTIKSSTTTTTAYSVEANTTGTLVLQTGATPTTAVTVGTDQSVTLAGTLAVQSQNMTPYTGFKNRIINSAMVIDQRGTASAAVSLTTSNQYTVDRWAVALSTAQSGTLYGYQVSTSTYPFTKALRLYKFAGTWSGSMFATQVIESNNCYDLAGQSVTVSFQARKGSDFAGTLACAVVTGTGTDQGVNGVTGSTWTGYAATTAVSATSLTTSFVTYTGTVSVPAGTNEIALIFNSANTSNSGSSNNWVEITGVQLEKGSTATSFDYRPYGTELLLCQRYFYKTDNLGTGGANASNSFVSHIAFITPLRTSPVIVAVAGAGWIISDDFTADFTAASPSVGATYSQSPTSWRGQLTGFTGLTVGRFYGWVPAVGNAISFSAEL